MCIVTPKASIFDTFVFNSGSGAFVVPPILNPRSRTSVVIAFDFYLYSQVGKTWAVLGLCQTFSFPRAQVSALGLFLGPLVFHKGLGDGPRF